MDTREVLGQPDKNAKGNLLWTRKTCKTSEYRPLASGKKHDLKENIEIF